MGSSNSKCSSVTVAFLLMNLPSLVQGGWTSSTVTSPNLPPAFSSWSDRRTQTRSTTFITDLLRGGDGDAATAELSLDEKVEAAMKKLGLASPSGNAAEDVECKDGVCEMPATTATTIDPDVPTHDSQDANALADRIAKEMNVDSSLAMAAIGATSSFGESNERILHEDKARVMIQSELDLMADISENSETVQTLVKEGFDPFLCRRALAFAENDVNDARAILEADRLDAEVEEKEKAQQVAEDEESAVRARLRAEHEANTPGMVEVKTNFDPTALPAASQPPVSSAQPPSGDMPTPAPKESVVFDATTAEIQKLVFESPVPVLLDVYADWCGPCKVLGPALEDMAVKAGGVFRLVKVNSDNNRPVSSALEVTALPTVFGIRDGKIVHMFQGMPKSEDMMKNFMMGLFGAAPFSPPPTASETSKYEEMTRKLLKTSGAASFSFSARERLTDKVNSQLDSLAKDDSVADVEASIMMIRTFLNNIVQQPFNEKFRKINLENKKVAATIGTSSSCVALLKRVGFSKAGSNMSLSQNKKVINTAPLVVARETMDKWIQANRKAMATAARKRSDEALQSQLQKEKEANGELEEEEEVEEEKEVVDKTLCSLKLRLDGKKKVHNMKVHEDEPLSKLLELMKIKEDRDDIQITCVAKRLVVKSSHESAMHKSIKEYGLMPSASVVVKVGSRSAADDDTSLKDRAAEKQARKSGSHTMQSIGIYAKDDNNKSELIDGGGGVWYEHDVSSDEEEPAVDEENAAPDSQEGDEQQSSGEEESMDQ